MTDEEYNKKYESKTVKQLCNKWKRYYIEKYKEWGDEETIKKVKELPDESIIKFGLSKVLEEIEEHKKENNIDITENKNKN